MKTLVVYYSRTGITRKVGEEICRLIKCDSEEILDQKNRNSIFGYLGGGGDAAKQRLTKIGKLSRKIDDYDLLVIGTPVWAWNMTPAIRTFITENQDKLKKIAFFCTMGGSGGKNAFAEMEKLCGRKPLADLELTSREAASVASAEKLDVSMKRIE
jgi:flavodoxin